MVSVTRTQSDGQESQASVWFFYFVAAALGFSFLATLLVLAWNNVIEREVQKFAYESLSIDDAVRSHATAAHDALENFAGLLHSVRDVSNEQLDVYAANVLNRYRFIGAIGIYRQTALNAPYTQVFASTPDRLPATVKPGGNDVVSQGFAAALGAAAPIPTGIIEGGEASGGYLLLKPRARHDSSGTAGADILVVLIDPADVFRDASAHPHIAIRLYSESEGIGGRQLLYERPLPSNDERWVIDTLEESTQVRFDRYSMRVIAGRETYWSDLDKGLLFTGLVLGAGVTLLLIALARAKELQARELRERNRVIEDQVMRQTRELAEARDQALEASRVKSDFLASMSHEIRTPLNAIIGMAELLSETKLSGDQQKYVGVFKNAGEALLSLVNDILDLSKIEAEQLVLEQIDFDVCGVVEQSADIYALKTAEKGIELIAYVAPDVPRHLLGDPARLRQVVLNLIGNAIKFTETGEIVVSVKRIDDGTSDVRLEFAVADTGIGIPADKLETIFGSFTQVDSSTTRKYGGTGLGLTISKKLVEMMDGRIWVESVEGEGSTFKFEAVFAPGSPPVEALPAVKIDLTGVAALIVDDSETNRMILREALRAAGATVTECSNGEDAVGRYAQGVESGEPFGLVLCDVQMPGMDGFAVVDTILQHGGQVKTLMMLSSSNLADDMERAKRIGLGGYLVKPVKRRELLQAIGGVFEAANQVRPASTPEAHARFSNVRHALLLAEDNPDNRLLIKAYLKREPFDVDEAENGELALEMFKNKPYDLVLMDVQMPIMDGHCATREIRNYEASQGLSPVPVIALTAHAIKEDRDRSIAAGCTAHLTKPVKKQTLLAALSEHLETS